MSKRWVCSKCGATAISKCVWQRSVFMDDMWAGLLSRKLSYSAKVQELDEETRKLARPDNTLQVDICIEVGDWYRIADADAMRIIELPYVGKPYPPTCRVGPKPVEPQYDIVKKRPLRKHEFWDRNSNEGEQYNSGPFLERWNEYRKYCKEAKTEYEHKIAKWEEDMLRHHVDMAEYNARFKAWRHYEDNKNRVHEHNKRARGLQKEAYIKAIKFLRELDQKTLDTALCCHSWLLDDKALTPKPCSLDTCTHATTGMMKKDRTDFGNKEG